MIRQIKHKKIAFTILFILSLCVLGNIFLVMNTQAAEQLQDAQKRILFISSYSYAWETVPQQIAGIKDALSDDVVLDFKFMDTKNVDTEESLLLFHDSLQYYLQSVPAYDVVITGDDAALLFVLEYREELFPSIPIIFEGVNSMDTALTASNDPLITGVVESLPYPDTIQLASELYPDATQIVAILDDSYTGIGVRAEFYKYAVEFPDFEFKEINTSSLSVEDFKSQIASLGEESILLFVLSSSDGDGNLYPNEEIIPLIVENASIPVFTVISIGMGRGLLGGSLVSQEAMGNLAGNMAMKLLNGVECSYIKLVTNAPTAYYFDENIMQRFGIKRSQLPDNATFINHEETFFEHNRAMIRITAVVVVLLLIFIVLLFLDNHRKKLQNSSMQQSNMQLSQTTRTDTLTSLLNRRVFMEDLENKVAGKQFFGVILFDIDNFKYINDTFGHNAGDEVLKELASRSKQFCDNSFCVYRLAGDEFTAIVSSHRKDVIWNYAKTLHNKLNEPYFLNGERQDFHVSMGIALFPDDADDATTLLAAADKAMYSVKKNGKNAVSFFN